MIFGKQGYADIWQLPVKMVFIVFLIAIFYSCENSSSPPVEEEPEPGSRNYSWKLTTIPEAGIIGTRMWAASPKKIWVVGSGQIWVYNGEEWKRDDVVGSYNFSAVYGTSANNVWAGTAFDGEFWHYDGSKWELHSKHELKSGRTFFIENFCGAEPDYIFAVGGINGGDKNNLLMHFDGDKWSFVDTSTIESSLGSIRKLNDNSWVITGNEFNAPEATVTTLNIYSNSKLTEIYRGYDGLFINRINGKTYLSRDNKMYSFENNNPVLFKDFSELGSFWGFAGRNKNDFFAFNYTNIIHFNGTDTEVMYQLPDHLMFGSQMLENTALFLTFGPDDKTHVLIGTDLGIGGDKE